MKFFLMFCSFILAATITGEEKPTVTATLSDTTTEVDQPVQLILSVENARVSRPPTVVAEGLSINFAGTSSKTQIFNSKVSSKTIFTYIVTPTKEGSFTIPPIAIAVGNDTYKTSPLTLTVAQGDSPRSGNRDEPYFGELVIPKESAYVGEQIPIELRFYFDRRVNYESYPQGQFPLIDGEGFVTKKYPDPIDRQLSVNGKIYKVQVYKTALTGVKPGKLQLTAANQQFRIVYGFGSGGNQGFGAPFQNFQEQVVTVKTNGAEIEIKPLPTAGRPDNFSGSIGDFTLTASAVPATTKVGDPIAMKVEIKGLGNFDRMDPPVLSNRDAWRVYDPANETTPLDDVGLSATKTFNFPIVPEKKVATLPTAEFSYFDPSAEKYVTLRSASVPVTVEEQPIQPVASPTASASLAGPSSSPNGGTIPAASPRVTASTAEPDILDIRRDSANVSHLKRSFRAWIDDPAFWIAQTVPALILILLGIAARVRKVRLASKPVRKLLDEQRLLEKTLNSANQSTELLGVTVRLLELHLQLASKNQIPEHVPVSTSAYIADNTKLKTNDLQTTLYLADVPESIRLEVEELLREHAEAAYGGRAPESVTQEQRSAARDLIRRWRTAI
jgi:hypothetical protein